MQRQVPEQSVDSSLLNSIKTKLFIDDKDKRLITRNLNDFDRALNKLLLEAEETSLQRKLAPLLRKYTLKHFRNEQNPYSRNFAEAYREIQAQAAIPDGVQLQPLETYFSQQERPGAWATDVVAGALADLFDVNLMVTPFTAQRDTEGLIDETTLVEQTTFTIRSSEALRRPIVNLYVINNTHWYCYKDARQDTIGDGNCFYNAFAQVCRQIILFEQSEQNVLFTSLNAEQESAYQEQQRLLRLFTQTPIIPMNDLINHLRLSLTQVEMDDHFAALDLASTKKEETPGSYSKELAQLQQQINTFREGKLKRNASAVLQQLQTISEPSPLIFDVIHSTKTILNGPNQKDITHYQELAAQVEGQPSFKLKALGALMLALAVTLAAVGKFVLVGTLAVSFPVTAALFSVAGASLISSMGFFAYSGRHGLARSTLDLAEVVEPERASLLV